MQNVTFDVVFVVILILYHVWTEAITWNDKKDMNRHRMKDVWKKVISQQSCGAVLEIALKFKLLKALDLPFSRNASFLF